MKKGIIITLLLFFGTGFQVMSQDEFKPVGKPIVRIFGNFHHGISKSVNEFNAFEIKRAYLGYQFQLNEHFKTVVKIDIGSPKDLGENSTIYRYAYFKNAYIQYKTNKFWINAGVINMSQFDLQEKNWSHRYIWNSYQDKYKYGPKADIGLMFGYNLLNNLSMDLTVTNGEGYKKPQLDDKFKYAAGLTWNISTNWISRVYYDIITESSPRQTLSYYLGYNYEDHFHLGGEIVYGYNESFEEDHDRFGFSVFGMYDLNKKWEVFCRYDHLASNTLEDFDTSWNNSNDGRAIIGGLQFQPQKFLKLSLNYQNWTSNSTNIRASYIFLNMEIRI